jgi:branched-chain amino acid transport system permease protein
MTTTPASQQGAIPIGDETAGSRLVSMAKSLLWLTLLAVPLVSATQAAVINEIAIAALFALSLDLVLGFAGIVSLGHAAFFGIGAYAAGLFARHVHPDPLAGLAVAMFAGAALGAVASLGILRGTQLTRLMITLGVALVLMELANRMAWLTGGADGLQGIVVSPLLGIFAFDLAGQTAALYSVTLLGATLVVVQRLVHAPFGVSIVAIRDNPLRASAIGIPVPRRLAQTYTIAAMLAAAAGALLAQTSGFVSVDVFDTQRSADVLLMLVIGRAGWVWGGVVGALVFKLIHDALAGLTPQYWNFWLGLCLVVLVLWGRDVLPWLRARLGLGGRS